jgi:hypothetical protein
MTVKNQKRTSYETCVTVQDGRLNKHFPNDDHCISGFHCRDYRDWPDTHPRRNRAGRAAQNTQLGTFPDSISLQLFTVNQEIPARVGLRRNASSENNVYGDTLHVNGSAEDIRPSASTSRASSLPQQFATSAKVNDYLVGAQLDEALAAGQDILISWPFADGDVRDWTQAEAIWYVRSYYQFCKCIC